MSSAKPLTARLLSVEQAAIYLGRTPGALRQMIFKGTLPVVRIGGRVQLDIRDLDRLIENSRTAESCF